MGPGEARESFVSRRLLTRFPSSQRRSLETFSGVRRFSLYKSHFPTEACSLSRMTVMSCCVSGGELAVATSSRIGGGTPSLLPGQEGKSDRAASGATHSEGSEKQGGPDASGLISAPLANHVEAGSLEEEEPSVGSLEGGVGGVHEGYGEDDDLAGLMPRVPWKRQRL